MGEQRSVEGVDVEVGSPALFGGAVTWRVGIVLAIYIIYSAFHQVRALYRVFGEELDTMLYYQDSLLGLVALLIGISWLGYRYQWTWLRFTRKELVVIIAVLAPTLFIQLHGLSLHHGAPIVWGGLGYLAWADPQVFEPWLEQLPAIVQPQEAHLFETAMVGGAIDWSGWLGPVVVWSLFWMLLIWMAVCTGSLVRRRWTEVEHFQYPLTIPPLAMTEVDEETGSPVGPLWRNPRFWIGVAISLAYIGYVALPRVFPALAPGELALGDRWLHWTSGDPWVPLYPGLGWSPLVIGLAYILLRVDILFSIVFFVLVGHWGLQWVSEWFGWAGIAPGFTWMFPGEQALGAFLALAFASLWLARGEIKALYEAATRRDSDYDNENEALSGPVAVWGFVSGLVVWLLLTQVLLNVAMWFSLLMLLIWLAGALAIARLRIQGGLMFQDVSFNPMPVIQNTLGTRAIGANTYTYGYGFYGSWLTTGGNQGSANVLGFYLESLKYGDQVGVHRQAMTKTVLAGLALAVVMVHVAAITVIHRYGGMEAMEFFDGFVLGNQHYWPREFMETYPASPDAALGLVEPFSDVWALTFVGVGALMTGLLSYLAAAFAWWPLHPVGYAIAMAVGFIRNNFWFAIAIAWVAKASALRWFGRRTDQKLRDVALGMVIGYGVGKAFLAMLSNAFGIPSEWFL